MQQGQQTAPQPADTAGERARAQVSPGNPNSNSGDQAGDRNSQQNTAKLHGSSWAMSRGWKISAGEAPQGN